MGSVVPSQEKVALITGGTSGIGRDLVHHLHGKGYRVAFSGRQQSVGDEIAKSVDPSGRTCFFVAADVKSYADQTAMFRAVWDRWGRLDVFVANAGHVDLDSKYNFRLRGSPVDQVPPEPDTTSTDINLKGAIYGTTLSVHFMRHNPDKTGGKIIVTGSMIGVHIGPTFPEYSASKAGVTHWVRTMAHQLQAKESISINIVHPGPYDTNAMPDFTDAFAEKDLVTKPALMSAYDLFVDDESNLKTGVSVEVAHDKLFFHDMPEYKAGDVSKRVEIPCEWWFTGIHGEASNFPGAVTTPQGPSAKTGTELADRTVKIIAVTGATGSQGGGVVNVMRKTPGWKVRALTRNPTSDKAKALAAEEGVEVVAANFDDEESLVKAFEGVHAVFAVTNWWEHLFTGNSRDEAGEIEEEQGMKLARAAARTPTLEHYLWSTTPSAKKQFDGALLTQHMDYKAAVDARIKAELPSLARRTTYLYLGYYPQNMAFFPLIKPIQHPELGGAYIQTLPTKPDAVVLNSGDMTVNPGIWVRQALATGAKAFGKYANVALEKWTFKQMLDEWSRITGHRAIYVQCTPEAWGAMWGNAGLELAAQFKYGELCDPWAVTPDHISPEELGIDEKEVVGFTGTIEGLKALF